MIAISYRREDSLPIAGRLYDRLQAEFGRHNVFMDFDSIPYGVDFREQIKHLIERSKLVVATIGPGWLGERGKTTRRIDDPTDFVRLEIVYALQRGIPIIPVLINNTPMPAPDKLPSEIEGLAFRNGVILDTGIDFNHHVDRLITGIRGIVNVTPSSGYSEPTTPPRQTLSDSWLRRRITIGSGAIFLVIAAAAWFLFVHPHAQVADKSKKTSELQHSEAIKAELAADPTVAPVLPTKQLLPADTEFGDGVNVELQSVTRGEGDITIKFKYTNNGSKTAEFHQSNYGFSNIAAAVYYIDSKNKKKYTAIKDAEGKPVASLMENLQLEAGASKAGWCKLPAPPADVTSITVVLPGAPPFEKVRVSAQ